LAELESRPIRQFLSTKTAALEQNGIAAVGVGSSESIVSQDAADRVAERIAIRDAENQIQLAAPLIVSLGL
jgi:hypothetical protein